MSDTAAQCIAYGETFEGTAYELGANGSLPGQPTDCSRLMQVILVHAGIDFTRSTYSQWGDHRYLHLPASTPPIPGDLLYLHVSGEADPGHVGMYVGNGQYLEAPHTGDVVKVTGVPNTSAEHVFGIIRPPYGAPNPPPAHAPVPTGEDMIASTPSGDGYWLCSASGAIITRGDAQYWGAPNTSQVAGKWGGPPNLPAGQTCVAITSHPSQQGYWIESSGGDVYAYGASRWFGNTQ